MRLLAIAIALAASLSVPRPASTCSPGFDFAVPPSTTQPYDADRAPPPPVIRSAEVRHVETATGCFGGDPCGFTGLFIELEEMPAIERLRITYPDGEIEYARPRPDGEGGAELIMIWQSRYELPGEISLSVVDDDGYGSVEVATEVVEG